MARICPLASSSSGNSTYISGGNTALLVDAGISCRGILQTIQTHGLELDKLKGILITHEHTDHIKGLAVLLKKLDIPLYASAKVLAYIEKNISLPAGTTLLEADKKGFSIGEIGVQPFQTLHDSVGSLGFRLEMPDGSQVGFATDLGEFTPQVWEGLRGCHAVVLESNYDESLLDIGSYPYYLKERIRGSHGHLSNRACADALLRLAKTGSARFMLAHLSEENNMPLLAQQSAVSFLEAHGLRENQDFTLEVAPKTGGKLMVY